MQSDEKWMRLAIAQARRADYTTWQNPRVGAVIIKDNQLLATGYTHEFGGVHAERDAIEKLTADQLRSATLYVTLEPCSHYGKQPPCANLIIDSGIRRVVIAETDPHALVTGKGIQRLRDSGVAVVTGVLADQAAAVNPHYNFYFQKHRPWVTLKQAISRDDKVAAAPGERTTITNQAVYDRVHQERAWFHGIVIGSQTAIVDNPTLLTTAPTSFPPVRIVLDRRGRLAQHPALNLLQDGAASTWVFTSDPGLKERLADSNAEVIYQADADIPAVVAECGRRGLQALYVEGGPTVHRAFLKSGLVNELLTYQSARRIGEYGVAGAWYPRQNPGHETTVEHLDDNIRISERMVANV